MLTAYERHLLASYLANAASGLHHRDREASALAEWVADRENRVRQSRQCVQPYGLLYGNRAYGTHRTTSEAADRSSSCLWLARGSAC